jgi:hypothetical protein
MRKLDEIIRELYIVEFGMTQLDNRYPRILLAAINGLKDLNNDLKSFVTEKVLDVADNDTVSLPSNYIDYLMIGIVRGTEIAGLGVNNMAAPLTTDDCRDLEIPIESDDNVTGTFNYNVSHYSEDGQYIGRAYGVGGGQTTNGYYKIYKDKNYIALNGVTGDQIVLRYLATIDQVDGNFMVEEYLVEAVKAYVLWKLKIGMRSYGIGDKKAAQSYYEREKKKALRRVGRFNIQEFVSALRSGYISGPKI